MYSLETEMFQISVHLFNSGRTSLNKCVDTLSFLRLRENYHSGWKSQLFLYVKWEEKMDCSNS